MITWLELQELCEIAQGATLSRLNDTNGTLFPIVQVSNLNRLEVGGEFERVRLSIDKVKTLEPGEVLLSLRGAPIRAAVVTEDINNHVVGTNVAILTPRNTPGVAELDPYYLAGLLSSEYMSKVFSSITTGGAVPSVSVRSLRTLSFPVPTLEYQRDFAAAFRAIDAYITSTRLLTELRTYRLELELLTHLGSKRA